MRDLCPDEVLLQAFLDEKLNSPQVVDIEIHVNQCRTCQERLNQLSDPSLMELLRHRSTNNQASDALTNTLLQHIEIRIVHDLAVTTLGRNKQAEAHSSGSTRIHSSLPMIWPVLPGFQIQGVLGHGGMGIVYQAQEEKTNTIVALKVILMFSKPSLEELEAFRQEAENMRRLHHPHIVRVFQVGHHQGNPFISMHLETGGNLSQAIVRKKWTDLEAVQLLEGIAEGIQYAHQQGVVHFDLKPGNILLTPEGRPKITDFGLARRYEELSELSRSGIIQGTPSYMAPEQATNNVKEMGPRTDIHGLGAILYQLLTGKPPFQGETTLATLQQVQRLSPLAPSQINPQVNRDLEAICLKCLAKSPTQRYSSAQDLLEDLRRWQKGELSPVLSPKKRKSFWQSSKKWHRAIPIIIIFLLLSTSLLIMAFSDSPNPDEAGPPTYTWKTPEGDPKVEYLSDGSIRAEHSGFGLLEVASQPPGKSFRFRAEVMHEKAFAPDYGWVGLYFGHRSNPLPNGLLTHGCCTISYTDQCPDVIGIAKNQVRVHTQIYQIAPDNEFGYKQNRRHLSPGFPFVPQLPNPIKPSTWREIVMENHRGSIQIWWGKNLISPRLTSNDIDQKWTQMLEEAQEEANSPGWNSNGGLGFYIHRGVALFRGIHVTPINDSE